MKPITGRKTRQKDVLLDPQGYFLILVDTKILVEFYSYERPGDVQGPRKLETVFCGYRADALCDTITTHIKDLLPGHYCYLGKELQRAEDALKNDGEYVQGGC